MNIFKRLWEHIKYIFRYDGMTLAVEYDQNQDLHNVTGPAILWGNGDCLWLTHGCRHRYYGPALYWTTKPRRTSSYWCVHGRLIK
jgi:hypothetical protein